MAPPVHAPPTEQAILHSRARLLFIFLFFFFLPSSSRLDRPTGKEEKAVNVIPFPILSYSFARIAKCKVYVIRLKSAEK